MWALPDRDALLTPSSSDSHCRGSVWGHRGQWLLPVYPRVRLAAGRLRVRAPARACVRPQLHEASCHRRDRPSLRPCVLASVRLPTWSVRNSSAGPRLGEVRGPLRRRARPARPLASCAFSGALPKSSCGVLCPRGPGSLNLEPPAGLGALGHWSFRNIVRVHWLGAVG